MFNNDIYDLMIDNDEMWYVYESGAAMIIYDKFFSPVN